MLNSNESVNILVLDYDDCTFSLNSDREDAISEPLIAHTTDHQFDAFYGCTHRSYASIDWLKTYMQNRAAKINYDKEKLENAFPTYKITASFANATQLPCYGVSTMDDYLYEKCSVGFENTLKPYEKDKTLATNTPYLSGYKIPFFAYYYGKNPQLLQIAKDAKEKHPNQKIQLTYVDDTLSLCKMAKEASKLPEWPEDVTLNIMRHDASKINATIIPLEDIEAAETPYTDYSYLPAISFFATKNAAPPAPILDDKNQPLSIKQPV